MPASLATIMRHDNCNTTRESGGYPYACVTADEHPTATVVTCQDHKAWWLAVERRVTLDVGHEWTAVNCRAYHTHNADDCTCNA